MVHRPVPAETTGRSGNGDSLVHVFGFVLGVAQPVIIEVLRYMITQLARLEQKMADITATPITVSCLVITGNRPIRKELAIVNLELPIKIYQSERL